MKSSDEKRPSKQRSRARLALGYLLIPFTGLLSPLIALPAVTTHFGAQGWAALAIGQSIGMAASAIGELGWGLNGPQRVARAALRNSYQILILSTQSKVLAVLVLAPVVGSTAYLLTAEFRLEAALIAVASLAAALNSVWFFLGKSRPWMAIATDGLPRILGVLIGTIVVLMGGGLVVYALIGLLLPCFVSPILGIIVARSNVTHSVPRYRMRMVLSAIFAQSTAFTARLISSIYIALPVTLVSLVAPASVPVFAAGERLMRLVLGALAAVPNGLQGWVGSIADREERWQRAKTAMLINIALGLVVSLGFGLLAPIVSELMFSGTSTVSTELAWVMGIMIVIVSTSRATGNLALVALSQVRVILWSAIGGALVGVPAVLLLSGALGAIGGALGEVIAEAVVLSIQVTGIVLFRRAIRRPRSVIS